MKAIILAGGYGTRLWPVSRNRPKMLLPLGEKVILDTILKPLERETCIEEVIISTNQQFRSALKSYVQDSGYQKTRLVAEHTHSESEKPGAIGALANLFEKGHLLTDVLVIAGDHYIDFPLGGFIEYFQSVDGPAITARNVSSKQFAKSYGVIEVENKRVVSFVEKPTDPPSTLISPACYAFPAESLNKFDTYIDRGHDPDAPGWFIQWLVNQTDVYAYVVDGMIMDVGTRTNYLAAVDWALGDDTHIADTATVKNSNLRGSVIVLGRAEIRDSEITDSVVFPAAQIEAVTLRDSVVDRESSVVGGSLHDSLIGPWTQLRSDCDFD